MLRKVSTLSIASEVRPVDGIWNGEEGDGKLSATRGRTCGICAGMPFSGSVDLKTAKSLYITGDTGQDTSLFCIFMHIILLPTDKSKIKSHHNRIK